MEVLVGPEVVAMVGVKLKGFQEELFGIISSLNVGKSTYPALNDESLLFSH